MFYLKKISRNDYHEFQEDIEFDILTENNE